MRLQISAASPSPQRAPYRWELAIDSAALTEARDVVDGVYFETLGLSAGDRPPPRPEPQRAVLLVRDDSGHAVGSLTLQSWAFERNAAPEALELEQNYALETSGLPRYAIAEVRRMAVLPAHLRALNCLLAGAIEVSEAAGIEHWIGLVEGVGGSRFDALLVHHALAARGLLAEHMPLEPLDKEITEAIARWGGTAFAADLKKIPLLKLRRFAALLGARAIGVPSLHPHYGDRVVVPMVAEVARFHQKLAHHLNTKEAV